MVRFTWYNPERRQRERGVFKVMKPYVRDYFAEDLDLLARLAKHLGSNLRNMTSQTIRVGGDRDSPGWVTTPEENDFPGLVSAAIEHLLDRSSASALAWL